MVTMRRELRMQRDHNNLKFKKVDYNYITIRHVVLQIRVELHKISASNG